MIRLLVLLLLGLAAAALVRAVLGDLRRRKEAALLDHLRASFLHGAPIAPPVRLVGLQEIRYQGLALRLPSSWRFETQGDRLVGSVDGSAVSLVLEGTPADPAGGGRSSTGAATAADAWHVAKDVALVREGDQLRAVYAWRLGRLGHDVTARLSMPAAAAAGILRQSDVTAIERAIAESSTQRGPTSSLTL
jgi:hypothetical protein